MRYQSADPMAGRHNSPGMQGDSYAPSRGWTAPVPSRRAFLRRAAAAPGVLAGAWGALDGAGPSWADEDAPRLIVRSRRPLDAETPPEAFDRFLTPNDQFFVRSHFGPPAVGLAPWALHLDGLVDRPAVLGLDDLKAMETVTLPAVLQCSGNGRSYYRPRVAGVLWERGAVGNAEWSGVRLADLLKKAGLKAGAGHVHLLGSDHPPMPRTPAFFRSLPIDRALDPGTLVATHMNGVPLPLLHGGPMRVVVPGWSGNHWLKWLRQITVARDEAPGFFMQTAYKMPKAPHPPGAVLGPGDVTTLTTLNVKSLFARPSQGAKLPRGRHEVRGVAWTGDGVVTRVEVSSDRDPAWSVATLVGEPRHGTWIPWRWSLDADRPGKVRLRVRATDSQGKVQPEVPDWNRSGYLWNGFDTLDIEIG